jgi:hypothetical protein
MYISPFAQLADLLLYTDRHTTPAIHALPNQKQKTNKHNTTPSHHIKPTRIRNTYSLRNSPFNPSYPSTLHVLLHLQLAVGLQTMISSSPKKKKHKSQTNKKEWRDQHIFFQKKDA